MGHKRSPINSVFGDNQNEISAKNSKKKKKSKGSKSRTKKGSKAKKNASIKDAQDAPTPGEGSSIIINCVTKRGLPSSESERRLHFVIIQGTILVEETLWLEGLWVRVPFRIGQNGPASTDMGIIH